MPKPKPRYQLLYCVGDTVRVRDGYVDQPIMATVCAAGASRVKVSYTDAEGVLSTRWVAASYVEQATVSQRMKEL